MPYFWIDGYSVGDHNWTTYGFRELDENRFVTNITDFSVNRF